MDTINVLKPEFNETNENRFGPARIEHRTAHSGLSELGTYFMTFDQVGHSDPWTLRYEETVYVLEGHVEIIVVDGEGEHVTSGEQGELVVLPKGITVRYGGAPGTRLLLSISPVNWRELAR